MLTSMTGHGQASAESEIVRAVAEVRSVNNRYLKITINCDLDTEHQAKLESLVKEYVNRGSVNLRLKTQFLDNSQSCKLNEGVLRAYWLQLSEIAGSSQSVNLESLLTLLSLRRMLLMGSVVDEPEEPTEDPVSLTVSLTGCSLAAGSSRAACGLGGGGGGRGEGMSS